jgi:YD repeat-containing protein
MFRYDTDQRLYRATEWENGTLARTYDSQGRTITRTTAKSRKVQYIRDSCIRVPQVKSYLVFSFAEAEEAR